MKKILVIGSINEDITLLVDKIPIKGETVIASQRSNSLGGKGANQAVASARMGGDVSFIGAIGNDDSADKIISLLESDNINTQGIKKTEVDTGIAYITIDKAGENSIVVHPGANFAITKEQIHENINLFKEADYCLLQLEIPISIIKEILVVCKNNDVAVLLNPAPFSERIDDFILKNIDFYIPNETEFLHTIGANLDHKYELSYFKQKGLEFSDKYNLTLIITLGSRGALLIKDNTTSLIPAQKVSPVDTTAAGDSFIGSFLSALSEGTSIKKAMNFASKVAALTISRKGAVSAIPYRSEIKFDE